MATLYRAERDTASAEWAISEHQLSIVESQLMVFAAADSVEDYYHERELQAALDIYNWMRNTYFKVTVVSSVIMLAVLYLARLD